MAEVFAEYRADVLEIKASTRRLDRDERSTWKKFLPTETPISR